MKPFPICSVGASAGGLDALIDFFTPIPPDSGMAFLVIQHLSPDHESIMDELLAPYVKMPVREVESRTRLEPNTIYLCPPAVIPHADGPMVVCEPRPKGKSFSLPINIYFEELAKTYGDGAIGVVLSGTGSDGSEGVKAIRRCGGRVLVQDPGDAEFSGMPKSAISTGAAHIVAPANELWNTLSNFDSMAVMDGEDHSTEVETDSGSEPAESMKEGDYEDLFSFLQDSFDLDFSRYRINSVGRRIERRMQLLSIPSVAEYLDYLKSNEDESGSLYHDLLIGVTRFFRDEESFHLLEEKVLIPALKDREDKEFRMWIAGCATGEEAYSLYILALEVKRKVGYEGRISMFATDVFKPSIVAAGNAVYSIEQMGAVSEERRDRYFQEMGSSLYKIVPEVRENVIFAQHNFLVNAPFTRMDLVSCRNVLIYLEPEAQEEALKMFSYALKDGGHLFLGGSESLGKLSPSFKVIASKARIFRKENSALDKKRWPQSKGGSQAMTTGLRGSSTQSSVTINRDLLSAYDSLLDRFAPCGFLINANREILHYFGAAADYCVNLSGRAKSDLLSQLDPDLKLALTGLTHQAISKLMTVTTKGIRCRAREETRVVDITVSPLKDVRGNARVFLVEIAERNPQTSPETSVAGESEETVVSSSDDVGSQVQILEDELRSMKENLEAANEELQVSNEELQATNEEMQVSNEELQSTNEELHSLNEELVTLNAEYERKNEELIDTNSNLQNLLESTEDGVLFVDGDLKIRNFNPAIASAFNLLPSDLGRPVEHIAYHLNDGENLERETREVVEDGKRRESETRDRKGRSYLRRIVPFRGADGKIEGALLTFTDVTQFHELEDRFEFAIETVGMSWWDWNLESGILEVRSAGDCLLGETCLDESRDREGWMKLVHPDDREEVARSLDAHLSGETDTWSVEHRFLTTEGKWLWVLNSGRVLNRDEGGKPIRMIGTTQDIDSYKQTLLRANNQREILEAAGKLAGLGVWEYDPENNHLYWSELVREILGVDEKFDPDLENAYEFYPQPDRDVLKNAFEKLLAEGVPYNLKIRCVSRKGEHRLTRSAARPRYDEKGKLVRVLGLFQDITESTRTEHEMEAFFSLSPDFQATMDFDGGLKSFNSSWSRSLGYSEEELTGMSVLRLIPDQEIPVFQEVLTRVKGGEVVANHESRICPKTPEGERKDLDDPWMSWSLSSDKQLGLIFVSARCVTDQKKANEALRMERIRAEEANRAKTEFLSVMSHELRTPLNPILGFAELLLEDERDPSETEILQSIVDSGHGMIELINEILDFAKIDAGKSRVEPVRFSLPEFASSKCKLMRGQIKDRPIKLIWELDEGPFSGKTLPQFYADVSILRQIARNLIGNAIKFTEEGEVVLRIRIESADAELAQVIFEVEDSGVGVPAESAEKIFEPFTQADSSATRRYGGTGMGLAICHRLVKLIGGSIWLESKAEGGSIFRFSVPLKYGERDIKEEDAKEASPKVQDNPRLGHQHRILIVEDNESNAFFIQRYLEKLNTRPTVAENGEKALEIMEKENFDLIFLDLHMPGIGGMEVLEHIRTKENNENLPHKPIAILTADVDLNTRKLCMKKGADTLITKPVKIETISKVLEGLLDEQQIVE